jgi:hypothetical protein
MGAGAIGAVAVDHRLGSRLTPALDQVLEQRGRDHGIAGLTSAAVMTSASGSIARWAL